MDLQKKIQYLKFYKKYQTMACNKCKETAQNCTCKKRPNKSSSCCKETINTSCVVYDVNPNKSGLTCFLGLSNGINLSTILEKLDSLLCVKPSDCAKLSFGLGCNVPINTAINKLLDYVCDLKDVKVKVSASDKSNSYLYDKIETGDCIKKIITVDNTGNQTLKLELDFNCIENKLSCCGGSSTVISIGGVNSICGNNTTTLTASTNCSGTITWSNGLTGPTIQASAGQYYATCGGVQSNVIIVTNTGTCNCVDTTWNYTGAERCQNNISQLEQISNCGNYRFINGGDACESNPCVNYKFTNITNQPVTLTYECQGYQQILIPALGCVVVNTEVGNWSYPANTLVPLANGTCNQQSFSKTRTADFIKSNCPANCTGLSSSYSQTYISNISQADADSIAANDVSFVINGQALADSKPVSTHCNCPVQCTEGSVRFQNNQNIPVTFTYSNCSSTNNSVTLQGNGCIVLTAKNGDWSFPQNSNITTSPNGSCSGCPIITVGTTHSCNGTSSANVTVTASGGLAPYSYSLDNNITFQTSNVFNSVTLTNHLFKVKDSNGCISDAFSYTPNCNQSQVCNTQQIATGNFTNNSCTPGLGCTGQTINANLIPGVNKTISSGTYCGTDQNSVNLQALNAANSLAQDYVNLVGTCNNCTNCTSITSLNIN
ncbi:MAG: SprB repeat-containing protein [Cetobacterium sp.]